MKRLGPIPRIPGHPPKAKNNDDGDAMKSHPAATPGSPADSSPDAVMMIGPEGSGKTVLAAVLTDFVAHNPQYGLHLQNTDYVTKKHGFEVLEAIREGRFPPSTRPGDVVEFQWEWGVRDTEGEIRWQRVTLIDPPGQDVRLEMTGQESSSRIIERIEESRVLIVAVDLEGYANAKPEQRVAFEWILEAALRSFKRHSETKKLLVVLTKADGLESAQFLHRRKWSRRAAMVRLIQDRMPTSNIQSYSAELKHPNCTILAVAAVVTKVDYPFGEALRVPCQPHESRGLPLLVKALVDALNPPDDRPHHDPSLRARLSQYVARWWRRSGEADRASTD
jgi:hypothetical protein